jgi:hypothetical protein
VLQVRCGTFVLNIPFDGDRIGALMDELREAWSQLMSLAAYRIAIVCARIAALAFLVLWVGLVVAVAAGMPAGAFVVFGSVAVGLVVVAALIAWSVVLLAARFVGRRSAATGGPRFLINWLPVLMGLYLRELLTVRRTPAGE